MTIDWAARNLGQTRLNNMTPSAATKLYHCGTKLAIRYSLPHCCVHPSGHSQQSAFRSGVLVGPDPYASGPADARHFTLVTIAGASRACWLGIALCSPLVCLALDCNAPICRHLGCLAHIWAVLTLSGGDAIGPVQY